MAIILNKAVMIACRRDVTAIGLLAVMVLAGGTVRAQSLMVLPVNVHLAPGQRATTLSVVNRGNTETAIQIRVYAWNQTSGQDQLTTSDAVLASPPLATIAPGATQVVRLVLRQPPQGREATYRIVLDQIPPPAVPGTVRVVLRMSIPIFAQPTTRALPHLNFHIEHHAEKEVLVAVNDGSRHEVIRDVVLSTSDGRKLKNESSASPYVLAGVTRRWPIDAQGSLLHAGDILRITAHADSGTIEQQVHVVSIP
ncbi:fimbria/pilus periplasmic chaperone [Edaphobacter paludis]|uniref:Fimbria/pilus periplasmic chaperone n=1 Tax=Edaphobacter paludis TaxID=3035702 RepID=A0AAU7DBU8_9BACT